MKTPLFVFRLVLLHRSLCLADWGFALTAPRAADYFILRRIIAVIGFDSTVHRDARLRKSFLKSSLSLPLQLLQIVSHIIRQVPCFYILHNQRFVFL